MSTWVRWPDGGWGHRPWWKVAVNTALRLLQPQQLKLVIATRCEEPVGDEPPRVLGYSLRWVRHLPQSPSTTARE